jgi:phosphoglycerate dehydrogenase-like enzyme
MHIIATQRVADDYGRRIRKANPRAKLIVPSIDGGALTWSGDIAKAEVCCFSEDFWQDLEMRRLAIPAVFQMDGLKWFHTFSAGVDNPGFQALIDRGAKLTTSSGASAPSIAQYVLAMMLHRAKRVDEWREQQGRREWRQVNTNELTGQSAGIIGAGAIGTEVARLAQAFNMRVVAMRRSARRARYADEQLPPRRLHALLAKSDFVVLACPLTSETEGMVGEPELRAMKPTATLINIARGRIVQEDALIRALKERWIDAAVLDVFSREPLDPASELWSLPNVIVTPHNSGFSPLNMDRAMSIFIDNLARFVAGRKMRNLVQRAGV